MLKATFSEEQKVKDAAIDTEDEELMHSAEALRTARFDREIELTGKTRLRGDGETMRKADEFVQSLDPADKTKFENRKKVWMENADCFVDSKDAELYSRFQASVFSGKEASIEWARHVLGELEAASHSCRLGEYGRNYQFVDPEFSPSDYSIGNHALMILKLSVNFTLFVL